MYRGWTQTDYQNKHYNINQKDEGTLDDRGRDGGTNFILMIKEQETRLTLQEHDDDDDYIYIIHKHSHGQPWQNQKGRGLDKPGFRKLKLFLCTPRKDTRQQRYSST